MSSTLVASLKDEINARLAKWRFQSSWRYTLEVIAFLGSVASVAGLVCVAIGEDGTTLANWVLICSTGVGIAFFWLGAILYRASARRTRYAEVCFYTHHVVHFLRNEMAQIELLDLRDAQLQMRTKVALEAVLDAICAAFNVVSGARCRASIKALHEPSMFQGQSITREQMCEYGEVRTLARDSISASMPQQDLPSKLNRNPRFLNLFRDELLRYYYCPTSQNQSIHHTDSHDKYKHGLPYSSVFVWPIRLPSCVYPPNHDDEKATQKLAGYLIVDCHKSRAFDEKYDFEVGALFADALFVFLDRCHLRYELNHGSSPKTGVQEASVFVEKSNGETHSIVRNGNDE